MPSAAGATGNGGFGDLRSHIGRVPAYDNGKIRRELGVAFRPARASVQDTIDDLRRRGRLPAA